jgi:predicted RNA-binding Zn-ribbon protein involved in translation (DUF1610 family)
MVQVAEQRFPIKCPKCGHRGELIYEANGLMRLVAITGGFDKALIPRICPECGEPILDA